MDFTKFEQSMTNYFLDERKLIFFTDGSFAKVTDGNGNLHRMAGASAVGPLSICPELG
jgi:hypothetical protein